MIDIINNKTKLLGDDLKREIKSGSKLCIAACYFSICLRRFKRRT